MELSTMNIILSILAFVNLLYVYWGYRMGNYKIMALNAFAAGVLISSIA